MKNQILNIALLIVTILAVNFTTVNAQSDDEMIFGASRVESSVQKATGAFGEVVGAAKSDMFMDVANANSPEFVRKPKMMTTEFTGYAIELTTVFHKPLALTDKLFQQYGGIMIVRKTATSYTYVLTNFTDKKAVEEYLTKMVAPKYSNATAVKYKNGEEVKFK